MKSSSIEVPIRLRLSLPVVVGLVVVLAAFAASPSQTGAPPQRTGAPGDGNGQPGNTGTCSDVGCHNTFAVNSGPGSVSINAPDTYVPGETVMITVSMEQSGINRFGFEISAKNAEGAHVGSWVLGPNTRKTIGNSNYLTHSVITESSWTFGWASPIDPQDVTFYVGGNAADGKFDAANDHVYTTSKAIEPHAPASVEDETPNDSFRILSTYPNPVQTSATVVVDLSSPEVTSATVVDLRGRVVAETDFGTLTPGHHELQIDVSSMPSGFYVLRLQSGDNAQSRSITVLNAR